MDAAPSRSDLALAREQRDQALACALLAVIVSVALVWANFSLSDEDVRTAQASAGQHRRAVQEHQQILAVNEAALADIRAALARIRPAPRTSP